MKRIILPPVVETDAREGHAQFDELQQFIDPNFSQTIIAWQKKHGRHTLPWQQTTDAYHVWLSEIMLQQTQVTAVIPYYQRFLATFPTLTDLATASTEQVMALWSGLGYYTRARNLHRCAMQVVAQYQGQFPSDPDLLQQLPGIGRSTAAAIAVFSYGTKAAILDGNVKRVFARVFGIEGYPGTAVVEKHMWQRAQALLPVSAIESYTQGLMDLGATICTRSAPNCGACPLQARCVAYAQGRTADLPTKKPKKENKTKVVVMLILLHQGQVLLEQRVASGIWGGLFSLPELDGMRVMTSSTAPVGIEDNVLNTCADYVQQFGDIDECLCLPALTHDFTHFRLHIHPVKIQLVKLTNSVQEDRYRWVSMADIAQVGLPAPVKKLLVGL